MASLHLSGPLRRLQAQAIDAAWLLGVATPWIWWCLPPAQPAQPLALLAGLLLLSAGAIPCWMLMGATPGQLLLSQRVVDVSGSPHLGLDQAVLRWAVSWVGLLAGGVGLLWMSFDPRRQGWQDRVARTLVVEPGADEVPSSTTGSDDRLRRRVERVPYTRRHLRGDLSVAQSLIVNTLLLPLPLLLLLGAVGAWTRLHSNGLWAGGLVLLVGWPLALALLAWGVLGVWRASRSPPLRPTWQDRSTALIAPAAAGLLLGAGLLLAAVNLVPRVPELAAALVGRDVQGTLVAQVSADGRRLQLKGPVGLGDAARVKALLVASPQLRQVSLQSTGGRLDEALQLADALRERGLPVRATGECSHACPLVFLAGSKRHLSPGARLGFHRISAGDFNLPYQGLLNRELRHRLITAGLTPHLATKAVATPPTAMWFPEGDELSSAGLVSVTERPLDVDLPASASASLADYAEALSASPLWQQLEQRFPGAQAEAAQRMLAAGAGGVAAAQAAGQEVVSLLLPGLLARASPETRWLFTEVLLAQINSLRLLDPTACRQLLLGDAAVHRRLPPALVWREAEWLLGALSEAPSGTPPRRPTALELEVIRRTLGPRAPQQLAGLWRPTGPVSPREPDCNLAEARLSELRSLAAPERRLALRLIYERE
ncbi:MAG: hypothetical protein RJA10_2219 [Pseudomonadota bacterium]|jgi:hypothetical protein